MKKWLKQYGIRYLLFFVTFLLVIVRKTIVELSYIRPSMQADDNAALEWKAYYNIAELERIRELFIDDYIKIFILGFLALHFLIFMDERNQTEREFLATLPIKKKNVAWYKILFEVMITFVIVSICALIIYIKADSFLDSVSMQAEWLGQSILGIMITTISYLIMILGAIHLLEALVIKWEYKLIVVGLCAGTVAMFMHTFNSVLETKANSIYHKLYGFFNLLSPSGCEYNVVRYGVQKQGCWEYTMTPVKVIVEGEECWINEYFSATTLNNYEAISNYIWYAVAYIAIAVAMFGVVLAMTKHQELSRRDFYFDSGSIIVGFMIGTMILSFLTAANPEAWTINIIATVIIIVAFVYIFHRKRIIPNK